jgi:hypothetical protein
VPIEEEEEKKKKKRRRRRKEEEEESSTMCQSTQPKSNSKIRPTTSCCILRGPSEERIVDFVPRGTELELQLRRVVGQAAHTRNNPQVRCKRQSSPVTGLEWPRGFQEVKVPRFHDNGPGWR